MAFTHSCFLKSRQMYGVVPSPRCGRTLWQMCCRYVKLWGISLGFCAQFNANGAFMSQSAGASGGISFNIHAMVDQYTIGPHSYSEGFFVSDILWYFSSTK